jgi:aspartyl/asparaginyl beta-hydroxylase (cupin superfamily)
MASARDIEQLVATAAAARQRGDRAGELRALDAALAAAPKDPLACNARGSRALSDGDFGRAAELLQRAVEAEPREPALWLNLATARRGLGDEAGEKAALEAAVAIDQRLFMGQLRLAEFHERTGALATAAQHWRNVLAMAPAAEQMPPALVARLAEARAFVAAQGRAFAETIDSGLAELRAGLAGETRRFDACVDFVLGRRAKIHHNEPTGLHFPFLPADEFFERRHFPWMAEVEAKTAAVRAEFEALAAAGDFLLRPYVQQASGTPENKWTPLDGSLDWGACFLWEYGVPNEPVLARCPQTAKLLAGLPRNEIPGRAPTAFFSLLKPGKRIPPHTGVTNTRAIVHLPLIVPENCGFRVGGETRQWRPGEAFAFDDTIEHEAWNDSHSLRVILIFDVWNPHLTLAEQQLLMQFFKTADASGHNPATAT